MKEKFKNLIIMYFKKTEELVEEKWGMAFLLAISYFCAIFLIVTILTLIYFFIKEIIFSFILLLVLPIVGMAFFFRNVKKIREKIEGNKKDKQFSEKN